MLLNYGVGEDSFFFLENTLESMISLVCEVKKKPQTNKNEPKKQTETQAYSDRKQIGVCQMGGDWGMGEMDEGVKRLKLLFIK